MRCVHFLLFATGTLGAKGLQNIHSTNFHVDVDPDTGALLSIVNPKDNASMSWISGPDNAPWQPLGSRWGLGYVDVGDLNRAYWQAPNITVEEDRMTVFYTLEKVDLNVTRWVDEPSNSFRECYSFTNTGADAIALNDGGIQSLGIYTPFNDHYTSTEDVLEHRSHAHIWASGASSSWVKLTRMGLRGPHLGLVLTEGALSGYSVESRDTVTSSNTRGVFLLHPDVPTLESMESTQICWTMFWHDDWEDFLEQSLQRSDQVIHVEASPWTAVEGESVNLTVYGRPGDKISFRGVDLAPVGKAGTYLTSIQAKTAGEQQLTFTLERGESRHNATIVLNTVHQIDEIIQNRVKFITTNQQISSSFPDTSKAGAYAVYDTQMEDIVTFDTASDRNTGRERVGMGVLVARWLQNNSDTEVEESLRIYYNYVINKLQDPSGYVYDWPVGSSIASLRLYDWPWVMQLHLAMAKLGNRAVTSHGNYTATPVERFMVTLERFYAEGGETYYPIGLPIYESLTFFNKTRNRAAYERALQLFVVHGKQIAEVGDNYPSSEVNYEQSIIAPAAIILLELYRSTGDTFWLKSAYRHFDLLEAFGGRQPDYHLNDVAIRHWDGYWFGKDRMWGDTFPHYWSTLTGIAMHHYSRATGDEPYQTRAEKILRANLVLFTGEGQGSCAFLYPTTVNGRTGHYLDPYANDQDWALAHILQLRDIP
ncbi:hypothetical protein ANOM_011894 [Aspergillus nomiae NRRL 13137]|uniref:Six-hairpin glycosidase n=1 Tax=Aspergillus nomiae NRRL (strain ATCC 15546 / NRRL 13137 / CBS 260.88 / M93) TaxID=1509407 RepID=A0A0L1IK61_ASPN3|nr:uncharacterized protein ANOM_011894 [Aspergillus nomiae NRRL 13137]KNG79939.1 hypothetical protein ANOM_011894 [Aspergillus nomiae NRRL 13137]